ncbi:MAG: hydroxysqualene dehydroxylase HpnE [Sulfuricellaceae bacterium]|nr:hydroxysqualene dehydroxylase HpnE [Sulfuricellaceae bacterium]
MADSPAPRHIAIIGGGYAGMAAAVALAERSIPVTVYESARHLGGRARSLDYRGARLDNGQHLLLGAYRDTLRLIRQVHAGTPPLLSHPLNLTTPGLFSLSAPRLPAPLHLAAALFTARGLSYAQGFAAARFMRTLQQCGFRLDRDCSVDALLARHGQNGALYRHLWQPLCLAALNTPPEIASARIFVNVLRDSLAGPRSASDLYFPQVGLGELFPLPAAAYVSCRGGRVKLGQTVRSLTEADAGYRLATADEAECFSHVIVAVAPQRLAPLLAGLPALQPWAGQVENFAYQPIYTVYLQYPAGTGLSHPMLGMAGGLGQWLFDQGRISGQNGLLAAVVSGPGRHERMENGEIARTIHEEIGTLLGRPMPPAMWHKTIAEKRATFSCGVDLPRPSHLTPLRNFFLAGDYTAGEYPATLEGAVRSGLACAAAVG